VERKSRRDGENVGGGSETIRQRITAEHIQLLRYDAQHAAQDQERGSVERRGEANVESVGTSNARLSEDNGADKRCCETIATKHHYTHQPAPFMYATTL